MPKILALATPVAAGTVTAPVALTNNVVPKGSGAATLTNSSITDNGTTVSSTEPFSSPGAGANSERYGALSTAAGVSSTAIGNNATASATDATAIGQGATASAADTTALGTAALALGASSTVIGSQATATTFTGATVIGKGAVATANNTVAIAASASATGLGGVAVGTSAVAIALGTAIGQGATTAGASGIPTALGSSASATSASSVAISGAVVAHAAACAIGRTSTTTAGNQFVMGSANFKISNVYFGLGVTSATASTGPVTINGTGGVGADIAGGALTLAAGTGTGAGAASILNLQVPIVGVSSSNAQTMVTALGMQGGKIITVNGLTTVTQGVPVQVATSDLTAQAAAITATTIYAVPAGGAGLYRVSYVATITTVDGTSAVLGGANGFQVKYTNASDSVVKTSNPTTPVVSAVNATGTSISGDLFANCLASTNLQFLFGYTGVGGQMRYDLSVRVEYLG